MCLLAIFMSSLEKYIFWSSAHFFILWVLLLWLSCMSSLHILDINPFLEIWFLNIFCHLVDHLFVLMMAFCFSDSYINFLSKQNLSLLLHLFINLITMNSWVLLYFSGYNQYYFTRIIMLLKLLKSCWILAIRKFCRLASVHLPHLHLC